MSNIKIYIAMHKKDNHVLSIKDPIYIPIHCGKAIYIEEDTQGFLPEFGDDTGDNISEKNQDYCELTAMYWIWKNDNDSDIVGLNHYRRYFSESEDDRITLMSQKTIEDLLLNKGYEYIINSCCNFNIDEFIPDDSVNSVYDDYKEMHDIRDLDNTLKSLHILYPNIADKIEYMIKHNYPMSYCNMLIAKKEHFNEYASFLFSVLNYTENNYGVNGNRGLGYTAERLFRPWLIATNKKMIQGHELDWSKYSGYRW